MKFNSEKKLNMCPNIIGMYNKSFYVIYLLIIYYKYYGLVDYMLNL